ncbi:unnamed protein product [Mytilus coruscus]|uniref:Fibronectin type-III domain-containing protein n=1 Tax=Mytilus coruscus TaxID=42192 RepID=A0A6J8A7G0_MYTCO|nr:unnamed protein product [Mytilus coruscus]
MLEIDSHHFTMLSSATSITLSWDQDIIKNLNKYENTQYEIKYRQHGMLQFTTLRVSNRDAKIKIKELRSNTLYDVNVYICHEDNRTQMFLKTTYKTDESCAAFLMDIASKDNSRKPYVYQLQPVSVSRTDTKINKNIGNRNTSLRVRYCDISEVIREINTSEEKTLLLLGATGTGKSTFINALMNYTAGVSYNDDHRFEHPGFNNTSPDYDKTITTQIEEVFTDVINHLDAMLIVVPACTTRLTDGQQHAITSILNMFGKDIAKNVFVVLTHYDGGTTNHVLQVIKDAKVPYDDFFKFNNSNVLSKFQFQNETGASQQEEIWNNRTKSFDKLFRKLENTPKTTLLSSIKVMRAQTILEVRLSALEETVSEQIKVINNYMSRDYKHVLEAIPKESPENKFRALYQASIPKTRLSYTYP